VGCLPLHGSLFADQGVQAVLAEHRSLFARAGLSGFLVHAASIAFFLLLPLAQVPAHDQQKHK